LHDGWQIVLTLDAKGKVKDRYLWGANQDELIATNDQFTLCDHLGSVRDIVDAGGKVLNHIEYSAFGKVTKRTGKSSSVFGYTGKMFDDATGLQWNINRWYDPNVGRWVSEDPVGFRGRDRNFYRYTHNCSISVVDVYGLAPTPPNLERRRWCCDEQRRLDLAKTPPVNSGGGVVCCDGEKVSCNWTHFPDVPPGQVDHRTTVQRIIAQCVIEHEDAHHGDIPDCPKACGVTRPGFRYSDIDDMRRAECRAFQAQIACLLAQREYE